MVHLETIGIERNGHELDGLGEGADELLGGELDEGGVWDLAGDDSLRARRILGRVLVGNLSVCVVGVPDDLLDMISSNSRHLNCDIRIPVHSGRHICFQKKDRSIFHFYCCIASWCWVYYKDDCYYWAFRSFAVEKDLKGRTGCKRN